MEILDQHLGELSIEKIYMNRVSSFEQIKTKYPKYMQVIKIR